MVEQLWIVGEAGDELVEHPRYRHVPGDVAPLAGRIGDKSAP